MGRGIPSAIHNQSLTIHLHPRKLTMQTTNPGTSMRKTSLTIFSVALLTVAGWAVQPATAQGFVPAYTLTAPKGTAPGANAKGIKDNGIKGCDGWCACNPSKCNAKVTFHNQERPTARQKAKFKAGADLALVPPNKR
jgi:hypothetical protein